MNRQDSQKIVLSSTSTVSLHDRFTGLLKHEQANLMDIRGRVKTAASLKNQRLALEMADRPSVLVALRNTSNINNQLCKVSVKSRLGQPLGRGAVKGLQGQIRVGGGRGGLVKGYYKRRGMSRLQDAVPTLGVQQGWGLKQHGGYVKWGGPMGIRGRGAIKRTGINSPPVGTGNSGFSVSAVYSKSSWSRFNSHPVPSREQLDEQLDEYMSKSRSHLDAELDAYMAQVDLKDMI